MSPTDKDVKTTLPANRPFDLLPPSHLEALPEPEKLAYFKNGLLLTIHLFLNTAGLPKAQEISELAWKTIEATPSTQELLRTTLETLRKTLSNNLLKAESTAKFARLFLKAKPTSNWLSNNFHLATQIADMLFSILHYTTDEAATSQIFDQRRQLLDNMRKSHKEGFPDPELAVLITLIEPKITAYIGNETSAIPSSPAASIPAIISFR